MMPALPLAIAALFLAWVSFDGGEKVTVWLLALTVPFIATSVLALLWKRIGIDKCRSPRALLLNCAVALASLAIFISVPLTHWPLRWAYQLSRPAFETIARSLRAGKTFPKPMQVGSFIILKAEIDNGKVCLWTDLDPSGRTGFAKCPPKNVPFNLWSMIELDENWQYLSED